MVYRGSLQLTCRRGFRHNAGCHGTCTLPSNACLYHLGGRHIKLLLCKPQGLLKALEEIECTNSTSSIGQLQCFELLTWPNQTQSNLYSSSDAPPRRLRSPGLSHRSSRFCQVHVHVGYYCRLPSWGPWFDCTWAWVKSPNHRRLTSLVVQCQFNMRIKQDSLGVDSQQDLLAFITFFYVSSRS